MFNTIFEIWLDEPFCGDYIDSDWLLDDDAVFGFATYIKDIPISERVSYIKELAERTKDWFEWTFVPGNPSGYEDVWFRIKPGCAEEYFRAKYNRLKEAVCNLSLRDFANDEKRQSLTSLIEETYNVCYFRIDGQYLPFDRFMRQYAVENPCYSRIYIGGIVLYNC